MLLGVGDLCYFRYINAELYDPELLEIMIGLVIDHAERGNEMNIVSTYVAYCKDGKIRSFMDGDIQARHTVRPL